VREAALGRRLAGPDAVDPALASLFMVGLNHQTADVELREQFFTDEVEKLLSELAQLGLGEAAVLFTCNRIEVYGTWAGREGQSGPEVVAEYFARRCGMERAALGVHMYSLSGRDAAMHLLRVAAGLESLVLGESEILGQVAGAAGLATNVGTMGPVLSRLFAIAVEAGKRVRTETAIGRGTLSVAHAGVMLAMSQRADFASVRVLIVGAGEMARLAVSAVQSQQNRQITIINRTAERARQLANERDVAVAEWGKLREAIVVADVVIAATGSATPVIGLREMPADGKPRQVVDLSVPRNVDAGVRSVAGVTLNDIDDLRQVVEAHRIQRQQEVGRAEAILQEDLERYREKLRSHRAGPVIDQLKRKVDAMVATEIERTLGQFPSVSGEAREAMELLAHRVVAKILRSPMMAMKEADGEEVTGAVRRIFGLGEGI
jgi:glutamyl-tRNA reductase